jgi:hypothetical protein
MGETESVGINNLPSGATGYVFDTGGHIKDAAILCPSLRKYNQGELRALKDD